MNTLQLKACTLTVLLSLFSISIVQSQTTFTASGSTLLNQVSNAFYPAGIVDMNGDGLDDVLIFDSGNDVIIEYQQPDGSFVSSGIIASYSANQWGMAVADVDGNGHKDIVSGGLYDGVHMLLADNAAGSSFSSSDLPGPSLFVQCTNFADINNDSHIDFFACHDDAESRIWSGDGTGTFTEADSWIDMTTTPSSDNSGNYGSTWLDIDRDGDLDLYIAKCRGGASSTTDPRRINALFINDGAGGWTEEAGIRGVASGEQTWASDFADLDNDGDFDLVMINHTGLDIEIFENDGTGYFSDVTASAGVVSSGFGVEVKCADFDNDGFQDILIAGVNDPLWMNDGDFTFTEQNGLPYLTTLAVGDLNNDGFSDIYTDPSGGDDELYINDANSNNYLNIRLAGTTSNIDGIGATVEAYGSWGLQLREVRSGESYGIVNTFTMMFGIGTATAVDSVVITWPSGIVDVLVGPAINQTHLVTEGTVVACGATSVVSNLVSVPGITTVSISWNALPDVDGYNIAGRPQGASGFANRIVGAGVTSLNLSGLSAASTYEWKIRARCQGTGIITAFSPLDIFTTGTLRKAGEMMIWPMPVSDVMNLNFPEMEDGSHLLTVTNLVGQEVLSQRINLLAGVGSMSLADLPPGAYLVKLGESEWADATLIEKR